MADQERGAGLRAWRHWRETVGFRVHHADWSAAYDTIEAALVRESQGSEREAALVAALTKISAIRDSIVGMQGFNFSEHAYPLVAALSAVGFDGAGYEIARANLGTLIEQAMKADAERDEAQEREAEALRGFLEQNDRVRELTAVLRTVEWLDRPDDKCCPVCKEWRPDGHAPDCKLAAALKEEK